MSMYPIASSVKADSLGYGFDFTNLPQTYTHLQVRVFARSATSSYDSFRCNFNADVTNANYYNHYMSGNGTAGVATAGQSVAGSVGLVSASMPITTSLANTFATYIVEILDYTNTNKYKSVKVFGGWDDNNVSTTNGNICMNSYVWKNTAAINNITLAGFNLIAAGTRVDIYGIKAA